MRLVTFTRALAWLALAGVCNNAGAQPGPRPGPAADGAPVLPHAEFIKACISGGGMSGHYPTLGSADLYQIGAARLIELSVLTEPAGSVTVAWVHPTTNKMITSTLNGSTTMAFSATSVKLMAGGSAIVPVSWCVRVR